MRPWFPPSWTPVVSPDETRTDTCGLCGEALPVNNRSLDFCNASCQDLWHRAQGEPLAWSSHLPADDHALSERIRSRWGLQDPGKDVA